MDGSNHGSSPYHRILHFYFTKVNSETKTENIRFSFQNRLIWRIEMAPRATFWPRPKKPAELVATKKAGTQVGIIETRKAKGLSKMTKAKLATASFAIL